MILLLWGSGPGGASEKGPAVIAIVGDSMADGLWGGVYRDLYTNPAYALPRLAKTGSGLSHSAKYDWIAGIRQVVETQRPDVAVVSIGLNDRGGIVVDRHSMAFGSAAWQIAYTERVDAIMTTLKEAGIPTFWIGLPVMRDEQATRDAALLNRIFEDRAKLHGVTYLPMWRLTNTPNGYDTFGPDLKGQVRQLRTDDGVHYTPAGYDMLAQRLKAVILPVLTAGSAGSSTGSAGSSTGSPGSSTGSAVAGERRGRS